MSIANPHDRFFRQSFGDRQLAAEFLTHYLPEDLADGWWLMAAYQRAMSLCHHEGMKPRE